MKRETPAAALLASLRTTLDESISVDPLDPVQLALDESTAVEGGTKKLFIARDARGDRYAVKACDPALALAEEISSEILELAGRAVIPTRAFDGEVAGVGNVRGLIKPFVELASDRLSTDTASWTQEQRTVLLALHPWEWLLDNRDGNESQYVLIGERRLPMMIDWDRAFHRRGELPLSRFDQHSPMLPNLRNFLYADYVEHRVDLDLTVLLEESRRVTRLPDKPVLELFQRYAEAHIPSAAERRTFVRRFMRRKKSAARTFKRFAAELARERRLQATDDLPLESRIPLWSHRVWSRITRLLDAAWRGPFGKISRAFLRWIRARRTVSAGTD